MSVAIVIYYRVTFKDSFFCKGVWFTPDSQSVTVPVPVYNGNADNGTTFASHCMTVTPLYSPFQ